MAATPKREAAIIAATPNNKPVRSAPLEVIFPLTSRLDLLNLAMWPLSPTGGYRLGDGNLTKP